MKHFACFKLPAVFRKPISSDSADANPNRLQADLNLAACIFHFSLHTLA